MINAAVQAKIDERVEALRHATSCYTTPANQAAALRSIAESLIVISEFIRGE